MTNHEEIAEKTERLQRMLAAQNLGGVLINAQHNFSWLTAGSSNGIDLSRDSGAASLLVRDDGRRFLLANRIELRRFLDEEVSEDDFEPIEFAWEEEKSAPDFVARRAISLLQANKTLGADLPQNGVAIVVEPHLSECRYELTAGDIERFRSLGHDAGTVIGGVARSLMPGLTEKEVGRRCVDVLATSDIQAIVTLVAADERLQKYRHPLPTDRVWKKALMIVICARRHGLIASLTRIVTAGRVPEGLRNRTMATAEVNARLLAATREGATGAELYAVAAESYAAVGFPGEEKLHHQGGACGYRTREWVAHPTCSETVRDREAFAWNPSITGTKVEETVILRNRELETITISPDWPQVEVQVGTRRYSSPDVLGL